MEPYHHHYHYHYQPSRNPFALIFNLTLWRQYHWFIKVIYLQSFDLCFGPLAMGCILNGRSPNLKYMLEGVAKTREKVV